MKEILDRIEGTRYVGDTVTFMSSPDESTSDALLALAQAVADDLAGGETIAEESTEKGTVWRCKVCGYEYEGEELPEDFVCPVCGVGPDQFEKI